MSNGTFGTSQYGTDGFGGVSLGESEYTPESCWAIVQSDDFSNGVINHYTAGAAQITETGNKITINAPNDGSLYQYEWFLANRRAGRVWDYGYNPNAPGTRTGFFRRTLTISSVTCTTWAYAGFVNGSAIGSQFGGHRFYKYEIGSSNNLNISSTNSGLLSSITNPGIVKLRLYCNRNTGQSQTIPDDDYMLQDNWVAFYYSTDGTAFTRQFAEGENISADPIAEWGIFAQTDVNGSVSSANIQCTHFEEALYLESACFSGSNLYTPPPCTLPIIGSDFTLNHYYCLPNQFEYIGKDYRIVPFFLGHPGFTKRQATVPYSGSID